MYTVYDALSWGYSKTASKGFRGFIQFSLMALSTIVTVCIDNMLIRLIYIERNRVILIARVAT